MKKAKSLSAWFRRTGAHKWAARPRFSEVHFEPYTKAIGQLLLAWNDLHEKLATLFVSAMGGGFVNRPLAVWHKTRMDSAKRELLRAAIAHLTDREIGNRPKLVDEITWILDNAKKLEDLRDDSAHGPLSVGYVSLSFLEFDDILSNTGLLDRFKPFVGPNTILQNPRALSMQKRAADLLRDFKYARERVLILRDYAIAIDAAWSNARLPWPDRPALPDRSSIRTNKGSAKRQKQK
jgi:hypothetical protein